MYEVTDPLLSVAVLQVLQVFVVPEHSESQQVQGPETVFRHDNEI